MIKDIRFMKENYVKEVLKFIPVKRKIFEIGAGYGNFTVELAKISEHVRAFEINEDLYQILLKKISGLNNVNIIKGDAFEYVPDLDEIVFSDLPFSKSKEFLLWIAKNDIKEIYAVVQSEFYEKLTSKPGTKSYTGVSVIFNVLFNAKKLLDIPSEAYIPQPHVHASFFVAKRIKNCKMDEQSLTEIINYMSKRNSTSRNFSQKKIFQLSPEEVLRDIGLQPC
jgi:16S rRNA A1518/A1519 N6-dimethyltransferase RsmA/KsgA/DIM1 with predicted DNA glycosylase/AP lyase activity